MILEHLGPQIDIHGGGHDLIFPHHENEIAQSESYTGQIAVREVLDPQRPAPARQGVRPRRCRSRSATSSPSGRRWRSSPGRAPDAFPHLALSRPAHLHRRGPRRRRSAESSACARRCRATDRRDRELLDRRLAEHVGTDPREFLEAMDDDFNTSAALAALRPRARDQPHGRGREGRSGDRSARARRCVIWPACSGSRSRSRNPIWAPNRSSICSSRYGWSYAR